MSAFKKQERNLMIVCMTVAGLLLVALVRKMFS